MAVKKPAEPSPESIARAARQRLALEEGAQAMAEVKQKAVAVRKNMERLRELRLAREAQEVRTEISAGNQPAKPKSKRRSR